MPKLIIDSTNKEWQKDNFVTQWAHHRYFRPMIRNGGRVLNGPSA